MNIPFFSLTRQNDLMMDEIRNSFMRVVQSEQFSGGTFVESFESKLKDYFEGTYAVCVNSGTSALYLALLSLGIKEGDEVIIPVNTFISTAWAAVYLGAKPIFVDCGEDYNIDISKIEKQINERTKAIIGVHLYGKPANLQALMSICKKHNLYMIEDCAQAFGATYEGKKVGTYGNIGCLSFYPSKNLGAFGEGGALLVKEAQLREHIMALRNHGSRKKYLFDEIGYNMRMDGLQAAILETKLTFLDSWNQRRCEIATMYTKNIKNAKVFPPYKGNISDSVYHLYVVLVDNRTEFMRYLSNNNIECGIHYPVCCHMQKALGYLNYKQGDFPFAEYVSNHCVSLPLFPELKDAEVEKVIEVINQY